MGTHNEDVVGRAILLETRPQYSRRHRSTHIAALALFLMLVLAGAFVGPALRFKNSRFLVFSPLARAASTALVAVPFHYHFAVDGVLHESGDMRESTSPYWWLNSGGKLILEDGRGRTIHNALHLNDSWRNIYSSSNSIDTAGGFFPQNIFRLVTRSSWENIRQEMYFRIARHNLTDSPQRNSSNGVLLFNRYKDGDNLYYAGIRVDGAVVIKKKAGGYYTTLAYEKILSDKVYDRVLNPSLLPENIWIGLRSDIEDLADGSVRITLYLDRNSDGIWEKVLTATDTGQASPPIRGRGHAGIRTDFIDALFDDFKITEL